MFSEFIAGHPKTIILLVILSLLFSGFYASQVRIGVDTGRFELRNSAYRTYRDIVNTFGSEEDNVIVVAISHNGSVLKRENIIAMLNLEEKLDNGTKIHSMQSIADYVATGIKMLDELNSLPENITVRFNESIFENMEKLRGVIANYEYILHHGNESAKNDSYRIFMLLPSYMNGSSALIPSFGNFTYVPILKGARYNDTLYNATTMLIEEMEIYQNISEYSDGSSGGSQVKMSFNLPENYSLEFLNGSIEQVRFNITQDKIGMENYNTTYLEWYSYNISFSFALSLLYSGQSSIALGIYRAARGVMLNNTARYSALNANWTAYRDEIRSFLRGATAVDELINSTEDMKNRSFGTLRDYLDNYSKKLREYGNSTINRSEVELWSERTENVSQIMINYTHFAWAMDHEALPLLNSTISEVENSSGYTDAVKLTRTAEGNRKKIASRIFAFYGEKVIFGKVLTVMLNLRSILLRDESPAIKEDAWNLLKISSFNFVQGNAGYSGVNLTPFHNALLSYRRWIHSKFQVNFTTMLWDYLSLEYINLNSSYSYPRIDFDTNFTRAELIGYLENSTDEHVDRGIAEIRKFSNVTVESRIANYTLSLNLTRKNLTYIMDNASYIASSYRLLGGDNATGFVEFMNEIADNASSGITKVNETEDEVYNLRMIEDFFSLRGVNFNTLLSEDELSTIIIIGLLNSEYEMEIYRMVQGENEGEIEYHTLSSRVLVRQIEETATEDMKTFLPLSLLLLITLLYLTYRSLRHVLLSLSAVVIALVWLFAFTAMVGWDFDPILLAVPILLIGIGIDDGIYVTLRYMEERSTRSRRRATEITVASVGGALILTTLTSMAGFLSNTVSSMEDLRRFGILAAAGLFFSFVVMNTFLPAANMLVDTKRKGPREVVFKPAQVGARIALKNPYIVIAVAVLISTAGVLSLSRISTEFNMKDLAPQDSEIVKYYHYYQRNFNASVEISYIYMEGNISNPKVLKAMAEVEERLKDDECVVHHYPAISPWSIMREKANLRRGEYGYNASFVRLFHESDTDGDGIPDRNITKLYTMLEPEIAGVWKGNRAIFIIHTDSHDLKRVNTLVSELKEDAEPLRKYVHVDIAGDAIVGKASIDEINENQMRSLALSVSAAILMLIVLFVLTRGSPILGIIAAIPILLVVTWNWLLMYTLGISLNVMTNTIASLCVGLGVDYGIHITHRFVEETRKYHSISQALLRATGNLGKGMIGASTTTIAATGILTLSTIPPLSNFALILSFSIFFSLLSAILVLPSLLLLWSRYRRKHGMDEVHNAVKRAMETGDYATLCRYHISSDYCLLVIKELIEKGKIKEAREMVNKLLEEGMDLRNLLRSDSEINPPFE